MTMTSVKKVLPPPNELEMTLCWRFTDAAIEATPDQPGIFAFFCRDWQSYFARICCQIASGDLPQSLEGNRRGSHLWCSLYWLGIPQEPYDARG
jgi:hypothetical protein